MRFKVGQTVIFQGEYVTIEAKNKGSRSKKIQYHNGIMPSVTSNPCTYLLSNGITVRGNKIKAK